MVGRVEPRDWLENPKGSDMAGMFGANLADLDQLRSMLDSKA
jgi:hypothetical protein